jgi:DNA-binding NarL/FixJ family response regulator
MEMAMDPIPVLLVDGNPVLLRLITLLLQQSDCFVVVGTAANGEECLALAQSLQPRVVVNDLGTPGLTGLQTIARLRETMPYVGIVATSLVRASGYREAALAVGADALVSKAALATDLVTAIRQVERRACTSGT